MMVEQGQLGNFNLNYNSLVWPSGYCDGSSSTGYEWK